MKFDEHLSAYLYENKSLKLEGIGSFTLDGKVNVNHENDKEVYYPIEGLLFIFNPKSETDDDLISFLVKRLGKIQPLVRSDLESYLSNIKQFINIGKPYTIQGIGTLSKNNSGTFEFTPGNFLPVKEELHPKRENEEHNYPVRNGSSAGKTATIIIIVIAALAVLSGIAWGISSLLSKGQQPVQENTQSTDVTDTLPAAANEDTEKISLKPVDTTLTISKNSSTFSADSARFKMIFEITKRKGRADRRTYQLALLHSYNMVDSFRINDAVLYRLYVPMKIRIADTTHIKDSLRIFYGGTITTEKQ